MRLEQPSAFLRQQAAASSSKRQRWRKQETRNQLTDNTHNIQHGQLEVLPGRGMYRGYEVISGIENRMLRRRRL
jgi:hypothetical protein